MAWHGIDVCVVTLNQTQNQVHICVRARPRLSFHAHLTLIRSPIDFQ